MSRARNIKPGFFKNDLLAECSPLARLLFIGLWCESDREGRMEDRPKRIRAECLPYDDCDIDSLLSELASHAFIIRYSVSNVEYIQIVNFTKHQNPHVKEVPSSIPAPYKSGASTVQASEIPEPARLIPSSLIPDSLLLIPDSKKEPLSPSSDGGEISSAKAQAIPYQEILSAYHAHLPMLPAVRMLSESRKKKIKARWHELTERQTVSYWETFFDYVSKSDFLTGRNGVWSACCFDWLIESANHLKVAEGNYENRSQA